MAELQQVTLHGICLSSSPILSAPLCPVPTATLAPSVLPFAVSFAQLRLQQINATLSYTGNLCVRRCSLLAASRPASWRVIAACHDRQNRKPKGAAHTCRHTHSNTLTHRMKYSQHQMRIYRNINQNIARLSAVVAHCHRNWFAAINDASEYKSFLQTKQVTEVWIEQFICYDIYTFHTEISKSSKGLWQTLDQRKISHLPQTKTISEKKTVHIRAVATFLEILVQISSEP